MKNRFSRFASFQALSFLNRWSRVHRRCPARSGRWASAVALCSALAFCLASSSSAHAATASFSTAAPTLGPSDISQLIGHVTGDTQARMKRSNVGGVSDDNMLYLDNGRPCQGQTFKTGTNVNGYQLT